MKFHPAEIPVAESMIQLAEMAQHPFQRYFSLWAAFNNIYTIVYQREKRSNTPNLNEMMARKTYEKWGYLFPKVYY